MYPVNRYLNISDLIGKFLPSHKKSYSQCGEDLIVDFVLNGLHINTPGYLDIGAHHATYLSNTYYFYRKGCRGVCIEPDPQLFHKLRQGRKRDVCLNVGVGDTAKKSADFYIMSSRTLSTFSRSEAKRYQECHNQHIERVIKIQLIPIDDIIREYFDRCPNYVSLDVEGMELDILRSLNFNEFRPEVFCIETLTYANDGSEQKVGAIADFMHLNGYMAYADTYINTIFVEKRIWSTR